MTDTSVEQHAASGFGEDFTDKSADKRPIRPGHDHGPMAHRRSHLAKRRTSEQLARMAAELKTARATLGLTLRQVARAAGVAPSTVQRAEAGSPDIGVGTLADIMAAVGLDLVLNAYSGRTVGLRDSGQMVMADQLRRMAAPYWTPRLEVTAGDHGQSADLVFHGADEVLHQEIERRAIDFQAQFRSALRKREYLAHRTNRPVRLVLVFEDTRHNREAIRPHEALIRTQLSADSRAILRSLRLGKPLGADGLLWLRRRRT